MRVGVGLPTSTPRAGQSAVLDWARRADDLGFASLGVIDRFVYDSWEPLTALAAAAAVTQRARLVTMILIGPLRPTAVLARQAATVDVIAGGRLILGLGIGARHDDYRASGIDPAHRGRDLAEQLARLRTAWEAAGQ
ncbi:MAG: LLM class flavin-dependent oxidoreductase, partial [Chloroflexota bacterium]